MYHYYGTANKNYHEYLADDMVKYKKYFYVLRPVLAYKWIEEKKLIYYKKLISSMSDDRNPDWEPLEKIFLKINGIGIGNH